MSYGKMPSWKLSPPSTPSGERDNRQRYSEVEIMAWDNTLLETAMRWENKQKQQEHK